MSAYTVLQAALKLLFESDPATSTTTTGSTGLANAIAAYVAPTYCTSSTSLAIPGAPAARAFTVLTGLSFVAGQRLLAFSAADRTKWMAGSVTSYAAATLTVAVDAWGGAGTCADWVIVWMSGGLPAAHAASHVTGTDQLADLVGDGGGGGTHGLVPAPAAGDAAKYLRGDGSWASVVTATPPSVYYPLLKFGGAANGVGSAKRVRCGRIYLPPQSITKIRWYLANYGTVTEVMDVGFYSIADGSRLAHTGVTNLYNLRIAPASPNAITYNTALALTWGGGDVILAWTELEGNGTVLCANDYDVPLRIGMEPLYGYPTETASVTGELPASITLPLAHPDLLLSRLIWIATVS